MSKVQNNHNVIAVTLFSVNSHALQRQVSYTSRESITFLVKVTGYSCARRPKCIGKCILKLANQKSRVRRA